MMFDYYFAYVKHITSRDIEADYTVTVRVGKSEPPGGISRFNQDG